MGGSLLLAVHCKKGDPVGLKDAVIHYVANTYGQRVSLHLGYMYDDYISQASCHHINTSTFYLRNFFFTKTFPTGGRRLQ
jgi:hypothetical protein